MFYAFTPFFFAALVCTEVASFLPWPLKYSGARMNGLLVGITLFFYFDTKYLGVEARKGAHITFCELQLCPR
jgi:hypothetical protein